VKGTDPETISLAPPVVPPVPVAAVDRDAEGRMCLEAREPGAYELVTVSGQTRHVNVPSVPQALEIRGPWRVRFAAGAGAPAEITLDRLISWSDHQDPGVKHFSGEATYSQTFTVPQDILAKDRRLHLDLGQVAVMAQMKLNGRELGTLWKPPFCVDITAVAKAGENALEVRVVNLWINRMIGDEQLPEDSLRHSNGTLKEWPQWLQDGQPSPTGRRTFTTWRLWKKDAPLAESGLLGPVRLRSAVRIAVE